MAATECNPDFKLTTGVCVYFDNLKKIYHVITARYCIWISIHYACPVWIMVSKALHPVAVK